MGPRLPALGRRSDMILRIGAVAFVIAGLLGAGVEGWLGRAALVLAGIAGLAAPANLGRTGAPPGRRGMVALGALVAALVMMFLAVTSGG